MQIEKSFIIDIADMSCIWNNNQRHVIASVLDGLLHLRHEEFVVLSHQIESRYGNLFVEQVLDVLTHTITKLKPVQEAAKRHLLGVVKKQSL